MAKNMETNIRCLLTVKWDHQVTLYKLKRIKSMMCNSCFDDVWLIHTFLCKPNRKINNETHSLKYNDSNFKKVKLFLKMAIQCYILESWKVCKCKLKVGLLIFVYITPGRATKSPAVMHQRLSGQAESITGEWPAGWHSGSDWQFSEGEMWVSTTLHSSALKSGIWSKSWRWGQTKKLMWSDHMTSLSLMYNHSLETNSCKIVNEKFHQLTA